MIHELNAKIERLQFEVTDWQERNERLSVEAGRLSVEVDRLRALAIEFARGHACDGEDFDAFVASLSRDKNY